LSRTTARTIITLHANDNTFESGLWAEPLRRSISRCMWVQLEMAMQQPCTLTRTKPGRYLSGFQSKGVYWFA
jgi:hypothetical protein